MTASAAEAAGVLGMFTARLEAAPFQNKIDSRAFKTKSTCEFFKGSKV